MSLTRSCVIFLSVAILCAIGGCSHERRDWHSAQSADTIEAYEEFVKDYPKSARTTEAETRVAQLTEGRDWKRASSTDTADAYRQFLAAHPQAKSAAEARIRIENFGLNGGANAATTPAVPRAPATAAPPPSNPAATEPAANGAGFGVQLGAFSTQAKAQGQWRRLMALYGTQLHGAVSDVERGKSANGRHVYRLRTNVGSEALARSLCAQLKKHSQACVVVPAVKR